MEVSEITKSFEEKLRSQSKSYYTIIAYKNDVEQFLEFCYESRNKKLNEINSEDIKAFIEDLKKKGYTMKSISRKLNSIKTFSRFAIEVKLMETNPAQSITHPKLENKLPRVLSVQEYRALRDVCREDPGLYSMFEVLLQTGMKIGELCRLKLSDVIYEENKPVKLRIRKYESTPERQVYLNEVSSSAISSYLSIRPEIENEDNLFLTKRGKPLLIRNVRFYLQRAFEKAGIKNATINDLRNTFIAHHLAKGTNILVISKMVGHKRLSTTEKYASMLGYGSSRIPKLEPL